MVSIHKQILIDDAFFSKIISTIPKELYKPIEDESEEATNTRFFKVSINSY